MAVGEAVLASEAQMHFAGAPLDEAPHTALIIVSSELARLPSLDAAGSGDLSGDDAVAQIGRQYAQPVDLARIAIRVGEGDEAAQRNASQPNSPATLRARRENDLMAKPLQQWSSILDEVEIDERDIQ